MHIETVKVAKITDEETHEKIVEFLQPVFLELLTRFKVPIGLVEARWGFENDSISLGMRCYGVDEVEGIEDITPNNDTMH